MLSFKKRLFFVSLLTILVNPGEFETTEGPKNVSCIQKPKRRRVAACECCGFVSSNPEERDSHNCQVCHYFKVYRHSHTESNFLKLINLNLYINTMNVIG